MPVLIDIDEDWVTANKYLSPKNKDGVQWLMIERIVFAAVIFP